jgi:hypothetical protein
MFYDLPDPVQFAKDIYEIIIQAKNTNLVTETVTDEEMTT